MPECNTPLINADKALVIDKIIPITADVTYPSSVMLTVVNGGGFQISAGKTLTIKGPMMAGQYKIFYGSGSVVFGTGAVSAPIPHWWGAKGDLTVTNEEAAFNLCFASARASGLGVEIPAGSYKVSAAISTYVPFWCPAGSGRTQFYPQGAFTVFEVEQAQRGRIGGFTVNYLLMPGGAAAVTSSCIGLRLMNSATTRNEQIQFVGFQDIIVRYGWHGIRYDASGDINNKGQLYEVSFNQVHFEYCKGDMMYLYATSGSLSVSLKHVTCDAARPTDGFFNAYANTAKGFYFFNIANLTLDQALASAIQHVSSGSVAKFLSCHGVSLISFQHEQTNITLGGAYQGVIAFAACEDVQLDMRSQNITINTGGGVNANLVYFDAQMKNAVIRSMAEQVVTVTSGTKKHFSVNDTANGAVNVFVLDNNVLRSNCDIGPNDQMGIRFASEINTYSIANHVYNWNTGQDYTAFGHGEEIIAANQVTPQTLTMPAAADWKGKNLTIHNISTGTVTIDFGGAGVFYLSADGSPFSLHSVNTTVSLPTYKIRRYYSDGVQWIEVGTNSYQTSAPVSATAAGRPGQWSVDASYLYVCTAIDTWKRVAIAIW